MPGIRTSALSLRAFGSNKVIKAAIETPGDSDLGRLPYCWRSSRLIGGFDQISYAMVPSHPTLISASLWSRFAMVP
jgi:hypothetical protein